MHTFRFDPKHVRDLALAATEADAEMILVKDQGTYLMSAGKGHNNSPTESAQAEPEGGWIAYAEGYDPSKVSFDEWWIGGDDYAEYLDAGDLLGTANNALMIEGSRIFVKVTSSHITMGFDAPVEAS